jgi:hypothetical protein
MDGAELELVGGGVEDTVLLELHPSSVLKIEMKTKATTDRKKNYHCRRFRGLKCKREPPNM